MHNYPNIPPTDGTGKIIADHFRENDIYSVERPNGMQDWLITFTLSGEGCFAVSGEELRCKAGDITLLKARTPHKYGTRRGQIWNFVWAHFIPEAAEIKWAQLPEAVQGFCLLKVDHLPVQKRIYRAFNRIIQDSRQTHAHSNELCMTALNEILLLLTLKITKPLDPRITQAIHYLTTKLKEPVQIGSLARAIGLSSSRLSHLFKAETGMTMIEMLTQMRLRQAALLLEHTKRSAAEVAWEVGFSNYNHFANQFKSFYGMNPQHYRKSK